MKRSPRLAALVAALMLLAACTTVTPSWAMAPGPIKDGGAVNIGDPDTPDGAGRNHYVPPGGFFATTVILGGWTLRFTIPKIVSEWRNHGSHKRDE
jgi:uncharacterized membrane protein YphA (DoxX/SURF4 family)